MSKLGTDVLKVLKLHDGRMLLNLQSNEPGWVQLQAAIRIAAMPMPDDAECFPFALEAIKAYRGENKENVVSDTLENIEAVVHLLTLSTEELLDNLPTKH